MDETGLTVTNSTFSGNSAAQKGGAISSETADSTVHSSTFTANSAALYSGAAIWSSAYTNHANLAASSLFANNEGADSCYGIAAEVSNLSDDATCGGTTGSTSIYLGSPGNYGGGTETIPLLQGSAGIDAGDPAYCPDTDQRGVVREGACDVGAFEYQAGFQQAPAITLQPKAQAVPAGDPVSEEGARGMGRWIEGGAALRDSGTDGLASVDPNPVQRSRCKETR